MQKNVVDRSLQVMLSSLRPFPPDTQIAIVDAPMKHSTKTLTASMLRHEDRSLRRNPRMSKSNQPMIRIKENMLLSTVGSFMLLHTLRCLSIIRIYKPKHNILGREFLLDAPYLRQVTIGDRAIRCCKKKNYR